MTAFDTMSPFTVILRYPESMQEDQGDIYFIERTDAQMPLEAAANVRQKAVEANEETHIEPTDFAVVAVLEGHSNVADWGCNL